MGKRFALVVMFVMFIFSMKSADTFAYASETEYEQEKQLITGEIQYVEVEQYCFPSVENVYITDEKSVFDAPLLRNSYVPYDFGRTIDYVINDNGSIVTLFRHELHGVVYLYADGKVHLYSLGSSISNIHPLYSAVVISNIIANTDGTVSVGMSEVDTLSKFYKCPKIYFTVTFNHGSSLPNYSILED